MGRGSAASELGYCELLSSPRLGACSPLNAREPRDYNLWLMEYSTYVTSRELAWALAFWKAQGICDAVAASVR